MDFPQPINPPALVAKEFPQPTQTVKTQPGKTQIVKVHDPAYHVHKCPSCGTEWSHTDASRGNREDHTCPTCSRILPGLWVPTQQNTKIVNVQQPSYLPKVTQYIYPTARSCPNGQCPR